MIPRFAWAAAVVIGIVDGVAYGPLSGVVGGAVYALSFYGGMQFHKLRR